jgi:Iap family predicted aminopeptidase
MKLTIFSLHRKKKQSIYHKSDVQEIVDFAVLHHSTVSRFIKEGMKMHETGFRDAIYGCHIRESMKHPR